MVDVFSDAMSTVADSIRTRNFACIWAAAERARLLQIHLHRLADGQRRPVQSEVRRGVPRRRCDQHIDGQDLIAQQNAIVADKKEEYEKFLASEKEIANLDMKKVDYEKD